MLEEKDKSEIERSFMEIIEIFKDSNTIIKTDHIAESKYQELLNFIMQTLDKSKKLFSIFLRVIE